MKNKLTLMVGSWLALASTTAWAHHSFAVFDADARISITGTIKDFMYVNPHCWLDVVVTSPDGTTQDWGFEGGPPLMIRTQGVNKDSFPAGVLVTVLAHPRKDGSHSGSLMGVTAADGRVLMAPRVGGPPPAAPDPTPSASTPAPN